MPAINYRSNRLLSSLPPADLLRWLPQLTLVHLPLGQLLSQAGMGTPYVYFPLDATVSLLSELENGDSSETALVGNEGMVGIPIFMGGESTTTSAVVHSAGRALRMSGPAIKAEFERSVPVMHLLMHYTLALFTQMAQTAICNRHHSVDQQLCRWLLMNMDRLQSNELHLTQELISHMLGVRREGVTGSALKLQRAGIIRYTRGHITVLDRAALERRTCECYQVVKHEYDRLLPERTAIQDKREPMPHGRPRVAAEFHHTTRTADSLSTI